MNNDQHTHECNIYIYIYIYKTWQNPNWLFVLLRLVGNLQVHENKGQTHEP